MIPSLRPLILGGAAGALGWKLAQKIDITFHEKDEIVEQTTENKNECSEALKPDVNVRSREILKYGGACEGVAAPIVYSNHVVQYDSSRRVPRWVAEHLTGEHFSQEVANRKGLQFSPDPNIPQGWTSDNSDYWGSGWSRGHMAPAGNNKHCPESMRQTFYLTNVVPQDIDNNGNYWNRLEIYCRGLVKRFKDVWIISGPLFLPEDYDKIHEPNENPVTPIETLANDNAKEKPKSPRPKPMKRMLSHQVIGPNLVSVPTHLFKVVVVEDPSISKPLLAAFIVPNKPLEDIPLTEFHVELATLEKVSGLSFLPLLNRSSTGNLCSEKEGCQMQNYKKFQEFFWERRLKSPWNLRNLERDWKEATIKGVVNEHLEKVYQASKEKLLLKESVKVNTYENPATSQVKEEVNAIPVAVAA